ncbi:MAG: hypothetical protein WBM44_00160 [Waterburya sp.]
MISGKRINPQDQDRRPNSSSRGNGSIVNTGEPLAEIASVLLLTIQTTIETLVINTGTHDKGCVSEE